MDLSTVLPGILLLGVVIFFHELGHFLAAKWRGVTVLKFSLGMGPEMVGFSAGGTRYCFSWIPLGGFVQMAGDSPNEDGSLPAGGQDQFLTHHWFGRVIIAVAGPFANLVTAFVVLLVMFLVGVTHPDFPNVLGPVPDTTSAFAAGLREGDQIVRMQSAPTPSWRFIANAGESADVSVPMVVDVERDGARLQLEIAGADVRSILREMGPAPDLAIVGSVMTGLPAYRSGLREGDRIMTVAGVSVRYFREIGPAMFGKVDQSVEFLVMRDGRHLKLFVTPLSRTGGADKQNSMIGIEPPRSMVWKERFTLRQSFDNSVYSIGGLVTSVYAGMWMSISRPLYYRDYVGGPIMITQMARDAARKGIDSYLWFLAMINIAIMAFNLLPIPLLDGGHILLALVEAVRRKGISATAYINFQKVGLVFVGVLFVLILSKDILRPFQRMQALGKAPAETTTVAPSPR